MSTHAVNQFETSAQRVATEPGWQIKPFSENPAYGLSAMTRTLFYTVLDLHPFETSLPEIQKALPEPAAEPPTSDDPPRSTVSVPDADDEFAGLIDWLQDHPESLDPDVVADTLEELAHNGAGLEYEVEQRVVRRAVTHLQQLQARMNGVLNARQCILAIVAATDLLFHPVTGRVPGTTQPVGQLVRWHLVRALSEDAG